MMVINNAYKTIKDSKTREEYNRKRAMKQSTKANTKYSNNKTTSTSSSNNNNDNRYTSDNFEYPPWVKQPFASSSASSSANEGDMDDDDDSLFDVISDFFREVKRTGGQGILEDLTEFLEEQSNV